MDSRTAAALCMSDLASIIEAGDFRQVRAAEKVIKDAVTAIPADRYRTLMLYRLGDALDGYSAPDQADSDAVYRAIRAIVRRQRLRRFERRRLTAATVKA